MPIRPMEIRAIACIVFVAISLFISMVWQMQPHFRQMIDVPELLHLTE